MVIGVSPGKRPFARSLFVSACEEGSAALLLWPLRMAVAVPPTEDEACRELGNYYCEVFMSPLFVFSLSACGAGTLHISNVHRSRLLGNSCPDGRRDCRCLWLGHDATRAPIPGQPALFTFLLLSIRSLDPHFFYRSFFRCSYCLK